MLPSESQHLYMFIAAFKAPDNRVCMYKIRAPPLWSQAVEKSTLGDARPVANTGMLFGDAVRNLEGFEGIETIDGGRMGGYA